MDLAADVPTLFADFGVAGNYQAYAGGAPSGAPVPCLVLDDSDGQLLQVGRVAGPKEGRVLLVQAGQVAAPAEPGKFILPAETLTIAGKAHYFDETRTIWRVGVRP